jgi:hypothetical protein
MITGWGTQHVEVSESGMLDCVGGRRFAFHMCSLDATIFRSTSPVHGRRHGSGAGRVLELTVPLKHAAVP